MYDNYEDYYEPSEFEERMNELKIELKNSVKKDIQDKIESLEKKNAELQSIKDNWNKLQAEHNTKIKELNTEIRKTKDNAARMRLEELFKATGMNIILFKPDGIGVCGTKCDKCDDDRYVHYKSPQGKDCEEECSCSTRYLKYIPEPQYLCEFRVNNYYGNSKNPLSMWFKKYKNSDDDGYQYDSSTYCEYVYVDEDYNWIRENHKYDALFKSELDCQKYCNWLNEQNGITDDMTTEKRRNIMKKINVSR